MKLLKIPESPNEIKDYFEFVNVIKEVQKFNNNIAKYFEKIVKSEFLKTRENWLKIASDKDKKILKNKKYMSDFLFYCYESGTFIPLILTNEHIIIMIGSNPIFKPSNCGTKINISFCCVYKKHNWPGWLPTFYHIKNYQIDLLSKAVKFIDENIREESNK